MPIGVRLAIALVAAAVCSYITGGYLHGYEYGYDAFQDPVMVGLAIVAVCIGAYFVRSICRAAVGIRQNILIVAVIFLGLDIASFYSEGLDLSLAADLIGTACIWMALICISLPASIAWQKQLAGSVGRAK